MVELAAAVAILVILATILFMWKRKSSNGEDVSPGSSSTLARESTGADNSAPSFPAGQLTVYFGSQTGTAEGFAEIIAQEGKKMGFDTTVIDFDDFNEDQFRESRLAICLLSTYGEGEPTDNAAEFVKWLKSAEEGALQGLQYSVFGLGNTEYEHFNRVGKLVDKQLEKLGASRAFELGIGDDSGTLEEDFEGWKEKLWPALVQQFHPDASNMSRTSSAADLAMPVLPFKMVMKLNAKGIVDAAAVPSNAVASTKHYFTSVRSKVVVNRELRSPGDGGSTRHVELDIHNLRGVTYKTADNLAVLPENDDASVERLASAMGWTALLDKTFTLEKNNSNDDFKQAFPTPCTVRNALVSYFDIHGMPRRSTLKDWVPFVTNPAEREVLQGMLSKSGGRERYKEMVEDKHRSLLELLVIDFPSTRVPIEHFLNLTPSLQPRYYTISSSSSVHPNRVHITVSVVDQPKPDGGVFRGVCSSFLQRLEPPMTDGDGKRMDESGDKRGAWPSCRIFVRASSFRLPADPKTPIVMVGPGTGIAPMRALLQERSYQREHIGEASAGDNVLYFGCKNREKDFLYREELEAFQECGVLTTLHLAFSRENPKKKVYVQHLMTERANAEVLWKLVNNQGAHVYVCGGTSMGTDVAKALVEVVKKFGGRDLGKAGAADQYVAKLKESGRYVQELWS